MYSSPRSSYVKILFFVVMTAFIMLAVFCSLIPQKEKSHRTQTSPNTQTEQLQDSETYTRPEIPQNPTIRVSEETRDFMFPQEDPLKEYDNNYEQPIEFERPEIPNVSSPSKTTQQSSNQASTKVVEFNPFATNIAPAVKKDTDNSSIANSPTKSYTLYNLDNTPAENFEIVKDFKINSTVFYVVAYAPDNIQKYKDFTNRKFYIYKQNGATIVQCFELYERQDRSEKTAKSLISINTDAQNTVVSYNGVNSVKRAINNAQLLSPYAEQKNKTLIIR